MILEKKDEDKPIIVLHTHLWSAITWPLITTAGPRRSTFFSLDPEGQAEWLAVFDPNTYDVVPAVPVMSEGWLCLESSSDLQPHNLFWNMWLATIHVTCLSFNCALLQAILIALRAMSKTSHVSSCSSLWPSTWAWTLTILWTWTRNSLPRKASHVTSLICSWFRMSWRTWMAMNGTLTKGWETRLHHMIMCRRESNGCTGLRRREKRSRFLVVA